MSEIINKNITSDQLGITKSFLKIGYDDYIAARILINHNLVLQGTILANTSIEKFLKALLTFAEIEFGRTHKITQLFTLIKGLIISYTPR